MKIFKRRAVVAVAAAALVLTGAGAAIAATTFKSGSGVAHSVVLTQDTASIHSGSTYTTVGSTSIFAGTGTFLVATFSAESACYNGSGWCSIRILIDGVEADPVVGTDFAFDSTDGNRETFASWESHSVQRTRTVTFTGFHTVTVQATSIGAGVTARYDDWALTVYNFAL